MIKIPLQMTSLLYHGLYIYMSIDVTFEKKRIERLPKIKNKLIKKIHQITLSIYFFNYYYIATGK